MQHPDLPSYTNLRVTFAYTLYFWCLLNLITCARSTAAEDASCRAASSSARTRSRRELTSDSRALSSGLSAFSLCSRAQALSVVRTRHDDLNEHLMQFCLSICTVLAPCKGVGVYTRIALLKTPYVHRGYIQLYGVGQPYV